LVCSCRGKASSATNTNGTCCFRPGRILSVCSCNIVCLYELMFLITPAADILHCYSASAKRKQYSEPTDPK
jgi:hypothetical protein